jgi:hypothetical protein
MKNSRTITSIFIVPTLKMPSQELIDNGYINGYLIEKITDNTSSDCVFLLFKPKYPSRFRKFVNQEYESTREIIFDYDIENGFTILKYRLNPNYSSDFDLIKKSLYSKTSKEFQAQFREKIEIKNEFNAIVKTQSLQYRIFNRCQELRDFMIKENPLKFLERPDSEIWYDFDIENETLKSEDLMEIVFESFKMSS